MAINTEKNTYTIAFAAVMVVIVGALLAFMASALSAKISENERLEKQQNILYAMGVNENEGDTTLHSGTLHYTILHYATLHCTALHYTTPHYTTLHYTPLSSSTSENIGSAHHHHHHHNPIG